MALPRPLPAPPGIPEMQWALLRELDPGLAAATWLRAHKGAPLEGEGENRSPLLRSWLYDAKAVDGQPYCGALKTSVLWALKVRVPALPGRHWFWHNRSALELFRAFEHAGLAMGRHVEPWAGCLHFRERPGGHHVDAVFDFDRSTRQMLLVGANVGDTISETVLELGAEGSLGFGVIPRRGGT